MNTKKKVRERDHRNFFSYKMKFFFLENVKFENLNFLFLIIKI